MYVDQGRISTEPRDTRLSVKLATLPELPKFMSAQIQDQRGAIAWRESPLDLHHSPAPSLHRWLTFKGLLTVRMKKACAQGFRLQLLEHGTGPGVMVDEEQIRRVILWCGEQACVYAESYLPREALIALPSLRRLGTDPLGEALQSHPDVSRDSFEYALLMSPRLPPPIQDTGGKSLWARRSRFRVGQSSLMVAEAFLPGIEDLPA